MFSFKKTACALVFSFFATSSYAQTEQAAPIPLDALRTFTEVFHQIHQHYVDEISDKTLLQYAIEGMLNKLDPHSSWLDKEDFLSLQEMTQGEFAGIGVEVEQASDSLLIITALDNTPAAKAGLLAGDKIIQIDEKILKGLSLNDSINLIRGSKGSTIQLTIVREEQKKPLVFKLKREIIKIESVTSRLINQNIAYLRIAQFQANSASDAKAQLEQLSTQNPDGLKGIILDLRNNPGGLLNAAVDLSDLFIQQGLIVYTQGRSKDSQEQFSATGDAPFAKTPIVVLINNGSASASEIVAGALQDHQRALIIGKQSFGKGSVQTILPIQEDNAIKLTTALYYTPLGRSIQAQGISPDIVLEDVSYKEASTKITITEASLARHLQNKKNVSDRTNTFDESLLNDYPVHQALDLLKAMQFQQRQ